MKVMSLTLSLYSLQKYTCSYSVYFFKLIYIFGSAGSSLLRGRLSVVAVAL